MRLQASAGVGPSAHLQKPARAVMLSGDLEKALIRHGVHQVKDVAAALGWIDGIFVRQHLADRRHRCRELDQRPDPRPDIIKAITDTSGGVQGDNLAVDSGKNGSPAVAYPVRQAEGSLPCGARHVRKDEPRRCAGRP